MTATIVYDPLIPISLLIVVAIIALMGLILAALSVEVMATGLVKLFPALLG